MLVMLEASWTCFRGSRLSCWDQVISRSPLKAKTLTQFIIDDGKGHKAYNTSFLDGAGRWIGNRANQSEKTKKAYNRETESNKKKKAGET
ncbi:hypothetical protein V6N12_052647 [Hibiscus sabdariffa]|uniref:Uncharacterized protein n=1 Tax=Hibiscus sabdariffa TaxID=183260 RepID=A0ABR2C2V0_9ROSI